MIAFLFKSSCSTVGTGHGCPDSRWRFSEKVNQQHTSELLGPTVHGWLAFSNWVFCVALTDCCCSSEMDCVFTSEGSISHGEFPGPWRHGHDITKSQWEGSLYSASLQSSLEDYRLCVLFLALGVWFETASLIQPYSGHQSLASRPERQGQAWKSAELQADSHWPFFSRAQVFLPTVFHSKWRCCFMWQRVSGEGWSLP